MADSTEQYEESHSVTTDDNGVFSLEIGTTEMMAVLYAIRSCDGDNQSTDEVPYNNAVLGLMANTTQTAIDELATNVTVDGDSDPNNEIRTFRFNGITNELSLTGGG